MITRTNHLSGIALNWAVAVAEGYVMERPQDLQMIRGNQRILIGCQPAYVNGLRTPNPAQQYAYEPASLGAQGFPIIERERISIAAKPDGTWLACIYNQEETPEHVAEASSPLAAAMRTFVASRFGETIALPDEVARHAKQHP